MAILRVGNDDRSRSGRMADEAIRTRVEVHRMLRLPGEDANADPVDHVRGCEPCLAHLREHAKTCADGKMLLEQVS